MALKNQHFYLALNKNNLKIRTDIQALRGFAVLVVLFYHAKISIFSAGYLGVDIFFVISGYLITSLIKNSIENNSFTFSDFYFRRAKRLLPAAYATLFFTALLAPFILAGSEMSEFKTQMIGAVTFTENIVLWRQSGYFEGASELKPLLHLWSLAIEEQYYFILPALMVFTPRKFWLGGAMTLLFSSLFLCFLLIDSRPEATFYLLPTRAWELMMGSVGALIIVNETFERFLKKLFWPAIIFLAIYPFIKQEYKHPGVAALLVCLATIAIILRNHPVAFENKLMKGLGNIGDVSYSLYLIHWPIFAFLNNVWIVRDGNEFPPLYVRIGLIIFSLLLAYLMHFFIEEPMRRINIKRTIRLMVKTIAASVGLVLFTNSIAYTFRSTKDYEYIRRSNTGFGAECEFKKDDFEPIASCRNSEKPEILVWGDSFAMHLVAGIVASSSTPSVIQATRSNCGPLLDVALVRKTGYDRKWAEKCIHLNDTIISYLKTNESIKIVVLSSAFIQFLNEKETLLKRNESNEFDETTSSDSVYAVEGLKKTVDAIRAMGKRVVVVAPPPTGLFNSSRCNERLDRELFTMGAEKGCSIDRFEYTRDRSQILRFLSELPKRVEVDVISFDPFLCNSEKCMTYVDGVLIYRDNGHLSYEGSVFLAAAISLNNKIYEKAK